MCVQRTFKKWGVRERESEGEKNCAYHGCCKVTAGLNIKNIKNTKKKKKKQQHEIVRTNKGEKKRSDEWKKNEL